MPRTAADPHRAHYCKGLLLTIMLTGGEAHDCPAGAELILQTKPGKALRGDKAYDSAELRASLKKRGTQAIIPNTSNRNRNSKFCKKRYRERDRIENAFFRLKDFRRIATRYDKSAANFAACVYCVAAAVWWASLSLDPRSPRVICF